MLFIIRFNFIWTFNEQREDFSRIFHKNLKEILVKIIVIVSRETRILDAHLTIVVNASLRYGR
jgi:hypothetical protein